jgi:hypothetical protein
MRYNTSQYNEQQYQYQILSEVITILESLIMDSTKPLTDTVFTSDTLTKQVTNKGLFDSIRLAEWMSKNRTNSNNWSD